MSLFSKSNQFRPEQRTRTYIVGFDKTILICYILLCAIGLFITLDINTVRPSLAKVLRHAIYLMVSFFGMMVAFRKVNMDFVKRKAALFLFISIALLLVVLAFGSTINGARRSFMILGFAVQPSFFACLSLILYYAYYLNRKEEFIPDSTPAGMVRHFLPLIVYTGIVFLLILLERHFSPLVITSMTLLGMLWVAQVRLQTFMAILLVVGIAGFWVINHGAEYRGKRMEIFYRYSLWPRVVGSEPDSSAMEADPYQVVQSLTSLANGKVFGTGTFRGRGKHDYIPYPDTDYVFTIIGEEFGFLGAMTVFGLFVLLFYRSMVTAWRNQDTWLRFAGVGLSLYIFFHVIVNVGVSMSALPSTGVTLPFISNGGTSLLVNSIAIGLILNIGAKRKEVW